MLSEPVQTIHGVFICLSRAVLTIAMGTTIKPFRMSFGKVIFQTRETGLVIFDSFLELVVTGLVERLLQKKGTRKHQ
jgi:hypothetical protein